MDALVIGALAVLGDLDVFESELWSGRDVDRDRLGLLVLEGEAEDDGENRGKAINPENTSGLSVELAEASRGMAAGGER